MIILHRKCDRIFRGSRPVIADLLYHGGFFCLPLSGKKVAELYGTNVCKMDKNREKHLYKFSKYSIHLKHLKHPFVQEIALYHAEMTANLQNKKRPLKGSRPIMNLTPHAFRTPHKTASTHPAHFEPPARNSPAPQRILHPSAFCAPRKTALKMQNRSRDPHHAPKSVADFAARRRQIILIVFWRDMRVPKNSSHGARVAAAPRAARHEAQCIPLKKRGRLSPSSFFEAF